MRKILIAIIPVLLAASSCLPVTEDMVPADDGTWGTLFKAWWMKMDTNYIFWYIDSPSQEWDDAYREYAPLFESIEQPVGTDSEADSEALRMLYGIISDLSDGHYALYLELNEDNDDIMIMPAEIRIFRENGIPDEDIARYSITRIPSADIARTDYIMEKPESIISSSLGIAMPTGFTGKMTEEDAPSTLLEEYTLIGLPEIDRIGNLSASRFIGVIGRTADGIIYIMASSFPFTAYNRYEGDEEGMKAYANLAAEFQRTLRQEVSKGGKGIIIDLRGNGGGYGSDLPYLFGSMIGNDITIGRQRRKNGPNRLSYGPWQDYTITATGRKDMDMPAAVLINSRTASCGEMASMLFSSMRDRGCPITLIGGTTMGANGAISGDENELAAGVFSIEPHIRLAYTPSIIIEYGDGESLEGKGVSPDIHVPFEADAFMDNDDRRLAYAIGMLRSGGGNSATAPFYCFASCRESFDIFGKAASPKYRHFMAGTI